MIYQSYAQEQLEHAKRRAENEAKEVPVLQGDKDMGSASVERDEKVLPGVRILSLVRGKCDDEEGSDAEMESTTELYIETLVTDELERIVKEHGLFSSDHEAWAVIKEELEEAEEDLNSSSIKWSVWWTRIRKDEDDNLAVVEDIEKYAAEAIKELIQVIACCRKWKQGNLKRWVESKAVKV